MLDVKKLLSKILLRLNNYTKVVETQTFTHLGKFWTFRRIGNVVFIDSNSDMTGTVAAGFTEIGTLNESLRPQYNVYLKCTNSNVDIRLYIYPSGLVTFYHPTATSGATNCGFGGYSFIVGGGYLTSKLYEIFSHLERWWEYVRLKGFVVENIKRSIQSCCEVRLLSTCKLQRDDTPRWFNAIYQITKRSLCGFLYSRCKNDASANGVGCNKDSGEQSCIGVYKPILLYIKRWWHIQILLRKQSRVLAQCYRYLERKYRLSSWRCGTNVRYGGYNITQISNERGCLAC